MKTTRFTMSTIDKILSKPATDAKWIAATAFRAYCENLHRKLYLCAGNGCVAIVTEDEHSPAGMWLVTGEHIPRNMEAEQIQHWAENLLRKAPYLPVG